MPRFVIVVLVALGVASLAVPAVLGASDRSGYERRASSILLSADLDNDRAAGAPQQQVVNGWVARDLLALIADQHNDALELQSRQLVLLLTIALLVAGTALAPPARSADRADPGPLGSGGPDPDGEPSGPPTVW